MRAIALLLLVVLACAAPSAPATTPGVAPPPDPRIALLHELRGVGLPDPLGWSRFVRNDPATFGERCDHFWQRPFGGHRVRLHDDLRVDYDGEWFAQWPAAMRVPAGSYDHVELLWSRPPAPLQQPQLPAALPADVLAEARDVVHMRRSCPGDRPLRTELGAVALASWISAMGHDGLAAELVARWPPVWDPTRLRPSIAQALARSAAHSFAQGMPRALVRGVLDRADALCDCGGSPAVQQVRDGLGDEPARTYDPRDPESMLAWLADDLVLFAQTPAAQLGWAESTAPRSPGLELVAMGWPALPALVAHLHDPRRMRANGQRRVGQVALAIVAEIARRPLGSVAAAQMWWAQWRGRSEFDAMLANLDGAWPTAPSVARLLALDPAHAVPRLMAAWPELSAQARRGLVLAHARIARDDPSLAAALEALLLRALDDDAIETVALAAGLADAGETMRGCAPQSIARPWVRQLHDRRMRATPPPTPRTTTPLAVLLAAIATADGNAAVPLLREGMRRERAAPQGVVARALAQLCGDADDDADDDAPSCDRRLQALQRELAAR
ncbi:MAG: hypothetical protein U0168_27905 [Nannocystaceae bacterium]